MPARTDGECRIVELEPGGKVQYWPLFHPGLVKPDFIDHLHTELAWQQLPVRMFGREILQPRLTAYYGDDRIDYRYSGLKLTPRPWTRQLAWLREMLVEVTGLRFNSVLCNLYRDGRDYMGWHADDEPELGPAPVIASLSFGACRRFVFKPRSGASERHEFQLQTGSLLLMSGALQRHWLHQLPKAMRVQSPRINLTFRQIRKSGPE